MKNSILYISVGLLFFASCSKEDSPEQLVDQTTKSIYVHTLDGENLAWEEFSLDVMQSEQSSSGDATILAKKGNSAHAHGDFQGLGATVSFSGTQNNGGAHGSAELEVSSAPGPGGPGGTAHVILETVSVAIVTVAGEEAALYGGIVTEVFENTIQGPPMACGSYDLGTYVYFVVKDNGQGSNAPADEFRSFIMVKCEEIAEDNMDVTLDFLGLPYFPWQEVGESNKIKIN